MKRVAPGGEQIAWSRVLGMICLMVVSSTAMAQEPGSHSKGAPLPARGALADAEQDRQQDEIQRRLDSLSKSVEKENRPATPSFSGRPGRRGIITFDDLKFDMKKGEKFRRELLTDSIHQLAGERLKLKGFIRPSIKRKGLTKFIFVRDNKECCFGPGAALYDCVLVSLAKGETSDYTVRPITVEGDFFLKEFEGPDGRVWAIYRMKNSEIK